MIDEKQPEVGDCVRYRMKTAQKTGRPPRVALILCEARSSETGEMMFRVLRYQEDDAHHPILEWWIYEHEILEIVEAPA